VHACATAEHLLAFDPVCFFRCWQVVYFFAIYLPNLRQSRAPDRPRAPLRDCRPDRAVREAPRFRPCATVEHRMRLVQLAGAGNAGEALEHYQAPRTALRNRSGVAAGLARRSSLSVASGG